MTDLHALQGASTARKAQGDWRLMALMAALTLPGIVARISGLHLAPIMQALIAGIALVAAAFLLAWAAEAAQTVIAGGLAIAILALITVLPEYAVDIIFAWNAAHHPDQAHYAVANMTGANRLLIGLGWSGVVLLAAFVGWRRGDRRALRAGVALPAHGVVEIVLLLLATAYALILPWRGAITLMDAVVLFAIFGVYLWYLSRGSVEEHADDLIGPPRTLAELPVRQRNGLLIGIFALATIAILAVAEPFAEGLVAVGHQLHVDNFVLVQVVAPIASEAPELVIVALFAFANRAQTGLQALVSSKVNQWTLLVGSIPLVYSLASGHVASFALDARQKEELLLTAAQSLLAIVLILDRHLGVIDSIVLLGLYVAQLVIPFETVRIAMAGLYFVLVAGAVIFVKPVRQGLATTPHRFWQQMRFAMRRQ